MQLSARKVGDEDELVRQLVPLSSVGKVIHRLQWEEGWKDELQEDSLVDKGCVATHSIPLGCLSL